MNFDSLKQIKNKFAFIARNLNGHKNYTAGLQFSWWTLFCIGLGSHKVEEIAEI
jgi:hypothetical protein